MTFQEWLPITIRNRIALGFAAFSFGTLVVWNCVPMKITASYFGSERGIFAMEIWPGIFDLRFFADLLKSGQSLDFYWLAIALALVISSLMALVTIPMWRFVHAAPLVKIPIALIALAGGTLVLIGLVSGLFAYGSFWEDFAWLIMSASMFSLSAALFIFNSELNWKPQRLDPRVPRSKN